MILEEVQLSFGQFLLDDPSKLLHEYGRIKDGSVILLVRKLTAHDTLKMAAVTKQRKTTKVEILGKKRREELTKQMEESFVEFDQSIIVDNEIRDNFKPT